MVVLYSIFSFCQNSWHNQYIEYNEIVQILVCVQWRFVPYNDMKKINANTHTFSVCIWIYFICVRNVCMTRNRFEIPVARVDFDTSRCFGELVFSYADDVNWFWQDSWRNKPNQYIQMYSMSMCVRMYVRVLYVV